MTWKAPRVRSWLARCLAAGFLVLLSLPCFGQTSEEMQIADSIRIASSQLNSRRGSLTEIEFQRLAEPVGRSNYMAY